MTPKRIVIGIVVIGLFVVVVDAIQLFTRRSQLSSSLAFDASMAVNRQYDEDQLGSQIRSSLRGLPIDDIETEDIDFTAEGLGEEGDVHVQLHYVDHLNLLVTQIPIEMTASGVGLWSQSCPDCDDPFNHEMFK